MTANKLRQIIAQDFLNALKQEKLPWSACWQQNRPMNPTTGKLYRGVNALQLSLHSDALGYTDPRWCTFNQAQEKGWRIRKGAKSCQVEYWAYYDLKKTKLLSWPEVWKLLKTDPDYVSNLQLRCRTYCVFNAEQIDGIPPLKQKHTNIGAIREQRDELIRNMGIRYRVQGNEAYYSLREDTVTLPPEASFDDEYSYMATMLHECGHATGHPARLDRDLSGSFGSESYAREELRAEIASAFTAQVLGLKLTSQQLQGQMQRHIAYVQSWIQTLEDDPGELFRAIKDAEKISDYLIEKGGFEKVLEAARPEQELAPGTVEPASIEPEEVETNIGSIPIEDFREIMALQNGFDSYDDMYSQGYRVGYGYDKEPEPTVSEDFFCNVEVEFVQQTQEEYELEL